MISKCNGMDGGRLTYKLADKWRDDRQMER